ncbi:MAG: cysteine desulfurase NifS [Candidatus Bathyarchaeota archaeon]
MVNKTSSTESQSFAHILWKTGAIKFGNFKLTSGRQSPYYIDLRVIPSFPSAFQKIIHIYAKLAFKAGLDNYKTVVGVPTTGLVYASALAYKIKKPLIYVRKKEKKWGGERKIEGALAKGEATLLIDDILTTGKSILEAAETIKSEGGIVKDALVLVDREEGGSRNILSKGIKLTCFSKISEIAKNLHEMNKITNERFEGICKHVKKKRTWDNAVKRKTKITIKYNHVLSRTIRQEKLSDTHHIRHVYMDHAATTPVDPEVVKTISSCLAEYFGNPSSLYAIARESRQLIEKARQEIADLINAKKEELIFTSGGTESDNIAIKGIAYNNRDYIKKFEGPHIITSAIEHPAVLETCKHLEKLGFKVRYLPVDKHGQVSLTDLESAIGKGTFLVTIMHANNEIGTIEPIEDLCKISKEKGAVFHTDAVQSVGKIPVKVDKLNVDLLSISSHKIYGPKGVGALFIKKGTPIESLIHGGGHEQGLRPGTENVPGIAGLGKAAELAKMRLDENIQRLTRLRDKLIKGVLEEIEATHLNGHPTQRLPNNAHFSVTGIDGEALILDLDEKGIAASTGSACSSMQLEPSHVLMAIGLNEVEAHGSLRLTLGRRNTDEDVEYVLTILPKAVERLRGMSPLWGKTLDLSNTKKC